MLRWFLEGLISFDQVGMVDVSSKETQIVYSTWSGVTMTLFWEYDEDYKYTTKLKKYKVDLNKPPEVRWKQIIKNEESNGKALLGEVKKILGIPGVDKFIQMLLPALQKYCGGDTDFHADMKAFADGWRIPVADVVTANLSYELAHFSGSMLFAVADTVKRLAKWKEAFRKHLGCTALCRWLPRMGWIHGRNMDWDINSLGPYSIIIEFKGKAGNFTTLSWPGFIGALQGVARGRFSATINWAPPDGLGIQWPPLFLLREVFNHCHTFSEAVTLIHNVDMTSSAFFMLCGVRKGEAIVIEKGRKYSVERWHSKPWLVQTNHHVAKETQHLNDTLSELDDELFERQMYAQRALPRIKINHMNDIYKVLNNEPLFNEFTVQQMVMRPNTGDYDFRGVEWI